MKGSAPLNLSLAQKFSDQCERLGVSGPPAIERARDAIAVAESHGEYPLPADTLSLTPAEIRSYVEDQSIRRHSTHGHSIGFAPGVNAFRAQVQRDAEAAVLPQLEDIIEQLRPRFEELSDPLVAAVRRFDFTLQTSADVVINMENDAATAAWRDARRAWEAIAPIVTLRKQMNEVFNLRPGVDDMPKTRHMARTPNISVLFAAGDNWSLDDRYLAGASNSLDWFELARGGLRLNSPREVDEKLAARAKAESQERARQARVDAEQAAVEVEQFLAGALPNLSNGSMSTAR